MRGRLEGIHNSQIRFDLRNSLVDAELTNETALEEPQHLEAVTKIEEEAIEPKFAVF